MLAFADLYCPVIDFYTMENDPREWLSTKELADWLGLTPKAIYWLNYTRQGPQGHKIGRGLRYRRSEVERWLRSRAA